MLRPKTKIVLAKENEFIDEKSAMLLNLINETNSVKLACERLNISYRKAWNILNNMEDQLGFQVVIRYQGGAEGGHSILTEEGKEFLRCYMLFIKEAESSIQKAFDEIFGKH